MKPQNTIKGLTFFPEPEFSDDEIAIGAKESKFFPEHDRPEVPKKYEDMASDLFFNGGLLPQLNPRVNVTKARRAINAWLRSWYCSHQSKISTVGYALWLWTSPEQEEE